MAGKDLIERGERRRDEMVKFIGAYAQEHGYAPTIQEIGAHVGISSPNAVRNHLDKLQEAGVITMTPRTPRTIRLVDA